MDELNGKFVELEPSYYGRGDELTIEVSDRTNCELGRTFLIHTGYGNIELEAEGLLIQISSKRRVNNDIVYELTFATNKLRQSQIIAGIF